jgi:glycosyltransferase involved in cell wall biosynthesis
MTGPRVGHSVLFDAAWWDGGPPSGQRVLRDLVREWARSFPEDRLGLACAVEPEGMPAGVEFVPILPNQHMMGILIGLPLKARNGWDALVTQNFTSPYGCRRRAVFIHDVIFQSSPHFFTFRERVYLSLIPFLARRASVIVTSSRSEAARIARVNRHLAQRVVSVGLALPSDFEQCQPVRPREFVPREFFLTVGRLNRRKNVGQVIEGLLQGGLLSEGRPLIVVGAVDGARDVNLDKLQERAVADGLVILAGHVSDENLKWYYENCTAFIFGSLDEGFGLPVLEARACGAPIVMSRIPAFMELSRAEDGLFESGDMSGLAAAVSAAARLPRPRPVGVLPTWVDVVSKLRPHVLGLAERAE